MTTSSGSSSPDLLNQSLKTLNLILRFRLKQDHSGSHLSAYQLKWLLTWAMSALDEPASQNHIFTLLKTIVQCRLVSPEIYDLMAHTGRLLLSAPSPAVRTLCSQLLLEFYLYYPMAKKRQHQQLEYLVQNLTYQHEEGRLGLQQLYSSIAKQVG